MSESVPGGPEALGHAAADQSDALGTLRVRRREEPASDQRDSQSGEIIGVRNLQRRGGSFQLLSGAAFNGELGSGIVHAAGRSVADESGGGDAGQRGGGLQELAVEICDFG